MTMPARIRQPSVFSDRGFSARWELMLGVTRTSGSSSFIDEVGAEIAQLVHEVLVAPADDADVAHGRRALGAQCRDEVAETTAQVGNLDVGAVQRGRSVDDGRLLERS